jgi:alginate O-acetyltransferase complex protein AlgI
MVFSSIIFLSAFLPLVLIVYPFLTTKLQNYFLLASSLFFYWWGEPTHLWIMIFCIICSWLAGIFIQKTGAKRTKRIIAATAIVLNLVFLVYFKYSDFILSGYYNYLGKSLPQIILPIGISFFVFQSISYIIDVYRSECEARHNIFKFGLYISLFPQLIAGPIVRYTAIAGQIDFRIVSRIGYIEGLTRFCFGLGKKMLLANTAGAIADLMFAPPSGAVLTMPMAWLGALAYGLQIYFDFSGYSDMAIGIGRALGFSIPENFNYPYISKSITEFWRRWHISLSSWFKDYLYIPLGGNRKGQIRTYFNLMLVFMLTGLWHGANWNFLVWGLWHGFFLLIEKTIKNHVRISLPKILKGIYCFVAVLIGWVLFRADTLSSALHYIAVMFTPKNAVLDMVFLSQINAKTILFFMASIPIAAGYMRKLCYIPYLSQFLAMVILVFSYTVVVSSAYNPFIYFRF